MKFKLLLKEFGYIIIKLDSFIIGLDNDESTYNDYNF